MLDRAGKFIIRALRVCVGGGEAMIVVVVVRNMMAGS